MVRRLLYFNGIAILAVILFHSTGWGFTAMISWTPRYLPVSEPIFDQVGSLSYYVLRFIEQMIVFAIPAFLFVSGYFIAFSTGRRNNLPWNQIFARIKKMLIPYTLWTLLIWAGLLAQGQVFSIGSYVVQYLTGSTTPAYYYIPLIIQFFLLSPLIVPLAKKHWIPLLIVTVLIQLVLQACQMAFLIFGPAALPKPVLWIALIPKWVFLARLFWFVFGVIIGFHLSQFKRFLSRFKWLFLALTILLIPLGMIEWAVIFRLSGQVWLSHRETVLDSIYALVMIFTFFAFTNVSLPLNKQVSDLGSKSFGIYLAHVPVMEYTARAIYLLLPWVLAYQILFLSVIAVLGLGIPLLMMAVVGRSPMRRYYTYIFG